MRQLEQRRPRPVRAGHRCREVPAAARHSGRLSGTYSVNGRLARAGVSATTLTRIATFVFANDGSNRSYRGVGVSEGHHDLSHYGGDQFKQEKIKRINHFHVAQLAYILGKLKNIPEGDGTLLDHCIIVYGSGISDGNSHLHDDLPILLAGKANGTIKTGRHVRLPNATPLTNLYVALLDRMGVNVGEFGDSTGTLNSLEG